MGGAPYVPAFSGRLVAISVRVNKNTDPQTYEIRISKNGSANVIDLVELPATTFKVSAAVTGAYAAGDALRVKVHRTSGAAQSEFSLLRGTLYVEENIP